MMATRRIEMTGRRFGRLIVLGAGEYTKEKLMWRVRCDCGVEKAVHGTLLRSGRTVSCGCKHREGHGRKHGGGGTREYNSWSQMIARTTRPTDRSYPQYGGRGIGVCERWLSFANFREDMGPKPPGDYSIDRIDNNRGYEPSNCRWATRTQQARNRRSNRWVTIDGVTKTVQEWSEIGGIDHTSLLCRLNRGLDPKEAVFAPVKSSLARRGAQVGR